MSIIRHPGVRLAVGYSFALAIIFFLARVIGQTWDELSARDFQFQFDLTRLATSFILLVVARGVAVEAWRRILLSIGEKIDFFFGARVWFFSNLTRYVPGNIWQVATMMVMLEARGVSKTNALLSQVVYTAIALAIAGLLGSMFLLFRPDVFRGALHPAVAAYAPPVAIVLFPALIIFLALPAVNRLMIALTARVLRRAIDAPPPTFVRGLVPPLYSLAMWVTNGVAFYLFVTSMVPLSLTDLPAFVAMNAGAYWIGYVSFITPSGLGFREAALALMLGVFFPVPIAAAMALAARLWSTVGELLGVVLIWGTPSRRTLLGGGKA